MFESQSVVETQIGHKERKWSLETPWFETQSFETQTCVEYQYQE
jgi:hypothetical protein